MALDRAAHRTWEAYNKLLSSQPLLTKALTSCVGFTAGDALAQNFVEKVEKYNYARTARLGSFGLLVHGTTGHYFYGLLDSKLPGNTTPMVFLKVLIDQIFWNPCFGLMFFTYLGLAEGKTFWQIILKIHA